MKKIIKEFINLLVHMIVFGAGLCYSMAKAMIAWSHAYDYTATAWFILFLMIAYTGYKAIFDKEESSES